MAHESFTKDTIVGLNIRCSEYAFVDKSFWVYECRDPNRKGTVLIFWTEVFNLISLSFDKESAILRNN